MSHTDGHGNAVKVGDTVFQDSWGYSGAILTNCGQSSDVLKLARTRALVDWTIERGTRWVSLRCLKVRKIGPDRCLGCGRIEDDCSRDPCADVIADRKA